MKLPPDLVTPGLLLLEKKERVCLEEEAQSLVLA